MNKRTSILLSTTMASIATAACAFCIAQSANAADVSASTSPVASAVSDSKSIDSTKTKNLKSSDSASINAGGGRPFASGSDKTNPTEPTELEQSSRTIKLANSNNTSEQAEHAATTETAKHKESAESTKKPEQAEQKKNVAPVQSTEQSSSDNSAQSSKPQQSANSAKDIKNPKTNSEKTEQSTYSASTGILSGNNSQNNNSIPQTLVLASSDVDGSSTEPVYDTEKNYTKTGEGETYISYSYVKNPNKITNPFSDVISDEEIEKAFKNNETSVEKVYFKPDATPDNPDPKAEPSELYTLNYKRLGILKNINGEYIVYKVYKNNYKEGIKRTLTLIPGVSINGTIAKDGSIYAGSESTTKGAAEPFTVELNGYKIADDSKRMINLEISSFTNHLYMKLTYKYKFNIELLRITSSYCKSACYTPPIRYYSVADAQFHFVDDLQYRAKNPNGVDKDGKLKQRGNSDTHPSLTDKDKQEGTLISAIPFHEIEGLQDIDGTTSVTTDKAGFYRNDEGDGKTSILSFDKDPDINYAKRPTLAELTTSKNIPGYVYWDNDIDKPQNKNHEFTKDDATTKNPGNHYLSFAYEVDKDGNPVKFLSRKHYYVTFRPIPTQLVVQYKGLNNQVVKSQKYAIYSGTSDVDSSLSSSENVPKKPDRNSLVKMAENKKMSLLSAGAGYLSDGYAYLAPGIYKVDPTAAAPEGYEWVVDSTSSTSAKVNIEVNKKYTDPTQQVVTFVLRKKPTPPTPPEPTPKPEPKPKPVPEPKPAPKPEPTPTPNIPDQIDEPLPMEVPFIIGPAVVTSTQPDLKQHSADPKPASTPAKQAQNYNPQRQKQGEYNYAAKHAAKHLPETGSATTPILASAIASLFAGFAGLAGFSESFAANRRRRD